MSKRVVSNAVAVSIALGLVVVIVGIAFVNGTPQAFGAESPCPCESSDEIAFSPSLSEPLMSPPSSQEAQFPGSGSFCGTLSLAYACRKLAIDTSASQIAQLINDKGEGVSMLDLARGAQALGLEAKGLRADLEGLKALPKPLIAFFSERKHFVVVTEANDKGVIYVDLVGRTILDWNRPAEFAYKWNGEVLVFSTDNSESSTPLTDKEMAQYIGLATCGPCNKVIQKSRVRKCEDLYDCSLTRYVVYLQKYGCANKNASMSCTEKPTHRGYSYPCRQGDGLRKCKKRAGSLPRVWGRINACR